MDVDNRKELVRVENHAVCSHNSETVDAKWTHQSGPAPDPPPPEGSQSSSDAAGTGAEEEALIVRGCRLDGFGCWGLLQRLSPGLNL